MRASIHWMTMRLPGIGERLLEWVSTCPIISLPFSLILGSSLATQLRKAIDMTQEHKARHAELTGTFSTDVIQKWEAMVAAWNNDPRSTNPYTEPVMSMFIYRSRRMSLSSWCGSQAHQWPLFV